MAIVITKQLPTLTGVYNENYITFTIGTGLTPTVTLTSGATNYGAFFATKIATNLGGLDYYTFDFTSVLKYIIGLPPLTSTLTTGLSKDFTATITGDGSAATTAKLTYIINDIGFDIITSEVLARGRNKIVYTDGNNVFFYCEAVGGTYAATLNGDSKNYTLVTGWNKLTLTGTHLVSGTMQFSFQEQGFEIIIVPAKSGYKSLMWLNREGCFSENYFRLISEGGETKKEKDIPLNYDSKGMERDISMSKTKVITLDCVAKDIEHYRQLTEIGDNLIIVYDTSFNPRYCSVKSKPSDVALCRQNLKFTITLEYKENVANY